MGRCSGWAADARGWGGGCCADRGVARPLEAVLPPGAGWGADPEAARACTGARRGVDAGEWSQAGWEGGVGRRVKVGPMERACWRHPLAGWSRTLRATSLCACVFACAHGARDRVPAHARGQTGHPSLDRVASSGKKRKQAAPSPRRRAVLSSLCGDYTQCIHAHTRPSTHNRTHTHTPIAPKTHRHRPRGRPLRTPHTSRRPPGVGACAPRAAGVAGVLEEGGGGRKAFLPCDVFRRCVKVGADAFFCDDQSALSPAAPCASSQC